MSAASETVRRDMSGKRKPYKGETATRWRGPLGKYFAEEIEDIRWPSGGGRELRWKEVLIELKELDRKGLLGHLEELGYELHTCPDKLKADYREAVKYWETLYSGRYFSAGRKKK